MSSRWLALCLWCSAALITLPSYANTLDGLLPNERNTVEIFQKFSAKVVYVNRLSTVHRSYRRMQVPTGTGSGIIWDPQGHIVTNFHVIKGAEKLSISIGKLTFPVKVVGSEPRKDLAVLAVSSPKALALLKSFAPFELVPAHELFVGQKTIAIGNPFGLDHSLSVGVISALGRQVPGIGGVTIRDMIQTDTSINPGNSGGPLLDSKGRLIGLNTIIYSNSGSSAGVGFAVPADEIARIVPQLIKTGRVVQPGIGVQVVEEHLARQWGVSKGLLIASVLRNTPASTAKLRGTLRDHKGRLRLGDVIVAINGRSIEDYDAFYHMLTNIKLGQSVDLTYLRKGKKEICHIKTINIAAN